ncbi:sugar transferase [Halomonas sp. B23F22_10]|uniref:sugar transferase n=1 Tax=Halomonas sp. B23F22_10 TaxID=3459515 RepID=UPI00373F4E53
MDTINPPLERQRRHSRFFERLLFSYKLQLLLGLCIAVLAPALWHWGWGFWQQAPTALWAALTGTAIAYTVSINAVQRLARLPGTKASLLITPSISICYGLLVLALVALGIEYSALHVFISYLVALAYCGGGYLIGARFRIPKLAVVPFGKAPELCHNHGVDWRVLDVPDLDQTRIDGVVADLRGDMPEEWERFLANCTIHRIPVYHATSAFEMLSGRVQLGHLYENRYGSLQPDEGYEVVKRVLDFLAALVLMPIVLPVMAITAVAIRMDSPGPAIFKQQRMGFHCRPFIVYKFRSMYTDQKGAGFTVDGEDPRITRVGNVIRKYRIDELPQLFNVLKGDMSLIGPRPESMNLADWYEKDVPFFHYRHVVRPGISGWAQVEQGYAAEVEGMIRKLEYDFYYIKNFSFWLDVLIVIRTLKTMLTGSGAR